MKYYISICVALVSMMNFSVFSFAQENKPAAAPTSGFGMFIPLIVIFVIFYFLIIRPQQKQAKQRQAMIQAVQRSDRVVTVGGIHGKIVGVADDLLTLEIADNCKIKVDRTGIQKVIKE